MEDESKADQTNIEENTGKMTLREVMKLPDAQKLFWGCVSIIITLASVVSVFFYNNGSLQRELKTSLQKSELEKGDLKEKYGEKMLVMERICNEEKRAAMQAAIDDLKARFAEKESALDDALSNANKVIATQAQTKNTVKKTIKSVSKIVDNEK